MSGGAIEAALAVEQGVAPTVRPRRQIGLNRTLDRLAPLAGLAGLLVLWFAGG